MWVGLNRGILRPLEEIAEENESCEEQITETKPKPEERKVDLKIEDYQENSENEDNSRRVLVSH